MKYVYLLQSLSHPKEHYVGRSPPHLKYLPWKLITYLGFTDEAKAAAFEKYLKSGSGQAFRNKHLL